MANRKYSTSTNSNIKVFGNKVNSQKQKIYRILENLEQSYDKSQCISLPPILDPSAINMAETTVCGCDSNNLNNMMSNYFHPHKEIN